MNKTFYKVNNTSNNFNERIEQILKNLDYSSKNENANSLRKNSSG
jgi:hypothetical protein